MFNRRHLLASFAAAAVIALAAPAIALDSKPFDAKAFAAAQASGKPILVEVHAPWCPVCRAQAPILGKYASEARFKPIVRFVVDFDSQKELLRQFNVQKQSTLIAFKGKQEVGRSVGDSNAASIGALLAKAI